MPGVLQQPCVQFTLVFGALQAMYFAAIRLEVIAPDSHQEIGPDRTIVILDGSGLTGGEDGQVDQASLQGMLHNPQTVMTFDGHGNRKMNDFDKAQIERKKAEEKMEKRAEKKAEAEKAAKKAKEKAAIDAYAAENGSHVFVTVSLTTEERHGSSEEPQLAFGKESVDFRLPMPPPSPPVQLYIETYRAVQPSACEWQRTSRGVMLRLRKRFRGHWARLLSKEGHDGKQGVDWARWSHPEADRAEKRDAKGAEFHRRNAARHKEITSLKPSFDAMIQEFRAVRGQGDDLEPLKAVEMVRLGETILEHYRAEREERTSLLGDKPLPAGVDEEALERALIELRELERKGELQYDRNTPSWKEFKRRQKERREAKKKRAAMRDAETKTSSRPRKPRKQQLAAPPPPDAEEEY